MYYIDESTIEELDAEYAKWGEFLNGRVGLLAFSFGLSCLGTPWPDITGFLSLVFLLLFSVYGQKHFPKTLKQLRKKKLVGVAEMTLIGIEKKYFGLEAAFKKFYVYMFGWLFLGFVSVSGVIQRVMLF